MGLAERVGDRLGLSGRHATFLAKVTVIELAQVPLVNAKFRVKWKFKTATTLHGSAYDSDGGVEGLGKSVGSLLGSQTPSTSKPRPRRDSYSTGDESPPRESADDSSSSSHPSRDYISSLPMSPPLSPQERTPNPNRTPTASHSASFFSNPFPTSSSSTSPDQTSAKSSPSTRDSLYLAPSREDPNAPHPTRRGATTTTAGTSGYHRPRAEPKGTTSFIHLRSHTATFKREIQCPVNIPVRNTGASSRPELQPAPLRLGVRQEVMGDHGKKEEAKTGNVVLDLSQFVKRDKSDKNSKNEPRRYLLKDCKTNAVLRVSVEMEWVGGEEDYVAPPLKSGQVSTSPTPSISSTSSFNRSSTSVNSRKPSSTIGISRTNSSSSMSVHSVPSAQSVPAASRGWRPATSTFSASPSPTLLGGPTSGVDRSAADIVDTLFNRVLQRGQAPQFERYNSAPLVTSAPAAVSKNSESLSFSVPPKKRGSGGSLSSQAKKNGTSGLGSKLVSSASLQPNGPVRRPSLGRTASSASTGSRARTVRWDDAEPPPANPDLSQSSSSSSLKEEAEEDTDVDERFKLKTVPKQSGLTELTKSGSSATRMVPSRPAVPGKTSSKAGRPIEWNKSWG